MSFQVGDKVVVPDGRLGVVESIHMDPSWVDVLVSRGNGDLRIGVHVSRLRRLYIVDNHPQDSAPGVRYQPPAEVRLADGFQVEMYETRRFSEPDMLAHWCDGVWHNPQPREPECPKCGATVSDVVAREREREEFRELFVEAATVVADKYYPKGVSERRGAFLRDIAMLLPLVEDAMWGEP